MKVMASDIWKYSTTSKALTIIFLLPIFTFIHRLVIKTIPNLGRGTSYRHHINPNIHNKSLRTRDPSELVSLRWIAFSLLFSVSLVGARWQPIIFMKLWNVCLLLSLQGGGWHHEFVKQVETIMNGSTKVHLCVRARVNGAPLLLFNI